MEGKIEPLPKGARQENNGVPEDADGALVTISHDSAAGANAVIVDLYAVNAERGDFPIVQRDHPQEWLQPWLASEGGGALTARMDPDLRIAWRDLPSEVSLVPSRKLSLPVKLTRPDDKNVVR